MLEQNLAAAGAQEAYVHDRLPSEASPIESTSEPTLKASVVSTQDQSNRAEANAPQTREISEASTNAGKATQIDAKRLDVLVRQFQQISRRHRLRVRRAIWLGGVSATALMLVNLVALFVLLQTERYPFAEMWWIWVLNAFVFAACVVYPLRSAEARRAVTAALASYEDVRVVGPLTELLSSADGAARKSARIALIGLLPRLTPQDAHWLNAEQQDALCRVLEEAQQQPELSEAILLAFAQVGDSRSLTAVQRVAEMPARIARHKRLQAVARQCLPRLRERIHYEGARQTLLRAHHFDPAEAATLLRVPDTTPDTRTQHLLRPIIIEAAEERAEASEVAREAAPVEKVAPVEAAQVKVAPVEAEEAAQVEIETESKIA